MKKQNSPPTIVCPDDVLSYTSSPDWVVPIANTNETPVNCTSQPGDSYPIGSITNVTCSTTDEEGQKESCKFRIVIFVRIKEFKCADMYNTLKIVFIFIIATDDLSTKISDLTKDVNEENVEEIAIELEEIVEKADDFQAADVQEVSVALDRIADIESPNEMVTGAVVGIVDAVLTSDTELTPETTSVILESLEQQISTAATDGQNYTQNEETLSVQTLSFESDVLKTDVVFMVNDKQTRPEICFDDQCGVMYDQTSITLPKNVVANDQKSNISFTSYYNSNLFQSSRNITLSKVILSATVYDDNLPHVFEEPITIVFQNIEDYVNATCVFWNTTLNGFGDWSEEGCTRVNVDDESGITCQCTHLTNFAVLFDFQNTPKGLETFLDIVTYVGCEVSIFFLLLTMAVILFTKSLRKLQPQKILLNLCASLTCLYITFICGIDTATPGTVPCIAIAVLLHYFLLASIAWTAVEAANMYLYFVKVVRAKTSKSKILQCSMVLAWGLPLIPPIFLLLFDLKFYKNTDYCYVNTDDSDNFIYAVVIPIAFVMACNCIMYIMVLKSLYFSRSKVRANMYKPNRLKKKKNRISNAIALSFLLGLTWMFGFLSFVKKDSSLVFLILFCVFNSLQGVAIFYFFIFRNRKTQIEVLNKN
ncbi:adhesion G-protein coupled receptor G6-like [Antedon mediterranea]|uniref:adhesion G-protein coupled receptor G6-like n=1 Tax=Antedon mediterranea TaxID=105859 RepID=UPI003AF9CD99